MMPHRIGVLGLIKLVFGGVGSIGSAAVLWAMDPDHAKAVLGTVLSICALVFTFGLREFLPFLGSVRKILKQQQIDLDAMGGSVRENAGQIQALQAEADRSREEAEVAKGEAAVAREVAFNAHKRADALQAANEKLHEQVIQLGRDQADAKRDITGLGEVALINIGDMKDPVKDKTP